MMSMGMWTENLSLLVVLKGCMLQSFSGAIRLFPDTRNLGRARFDRLRAAATFLVSDKGAAARRARRGEQMRAAQTRHKTTAGERHQMERV
jgi:hypothetical protein